MFRFFRRGKKEKPVKEKKEEVPPPDIIDSKPISEDQSILPEYKISEITFEEKFKNMSKFLSETLPDDSLIEEPIISFSPLIPLIEKIYDREDSVHSFISPQVLVEKKDEPSIDNLSVFYSKEGLPSITLEEKLEGALFSIGRPIHTDELIEALEGDSPVIKRAIRKIYRKRRKSSPIILTEISKDRWVLQLNPIYYEFFASYLPERFMEEPERRILTEIAYRQPISVAMVKKIVKEIGPMTINQLCESLEQRGYIVGEERARSLVYTTTPKFAKDFGFDNESRRLKLQMLWRLRRLMGGYYDDEEEEELEQEEVGEGVEDNESMLEAHKDEKTAEVELYAIEDHKEEIKDILEESEQEELGKDVEDKESMLETANYETTSEDEPYAIEDPKEKIEDTKEELELDLEKETLIKMEDSLKEVIKEEEE